MKTFQLVEENKVYIEKSKGFCDYCEILKECLSRKKGGYFVRICAECVGLMSEIISHEATQEALDHSANPINVE